MGIKGTNQKKTDYDVIYVRPRFAIISLSLPFIRTFMGLSAQSIKN